MPSPACQPLLTNPFGQASFPVPRPLPVFRASSSPLHDITCNVTPPSTKHYHCITAVCPQNQHASMIWKRLCSFFMLSPLIPKTLYMCTPRHICSPSCIVYENPRVFLYRILPGIEIFASLFSLLQFQRLCTCAHHREFAAHVALHMKSHWSGCPEDPFLT